MIGLLSPGQVDLPCNAYGDLQLAWERLAREEGGGKLRRQETSQKFLEGAHIPGQEGKRGKHDQAPGSDQKLRRSLTPSD